MFVTWAEVIFEGDQLGLGHSRHFPKVVSLQLEQWARNIQDAWRPKQGSWTIKKRNRILTKNLQKQEIHNGQPVGVIFKMSQKNTKNESSLTFIQGSLTEWSETNQPNTELNTQTKKERK